MFGKHEARRGGAIRAAARTARLAIVCHPDTWVTLRSVPVIGLDEVSDDRVKTAGEHLVQVELSGAQVTRVLDAECGTWGLYGATQHGQMYGRCKPGTKDLLLALCFAMEDALLAEGDQAEPVRFDRTIGVPQP